MKKIKLLIDNFSFSSKPSGEEMARVQQRLRDKNSLKEVGIEELFNYIKKGYTFVPAVMTNGAKDENWQQQEVIFIDIDNDDINNIVTPEEIIKELKENSLEPLGYYYTFSSTNDLPRFRVLFLLDTPMKDRNKMSFIIETLTEFMKGDTACKNLSRVFYGTNGNNQEVVLLNEKAVITLDDVINLKNKINQHQLDMLSSDNNLNTLIRNFDLLEYMSRDNEISHTSSDVTYFKTCSICGHNDCLRYYKQTNSFYCFGKSGNKGGTIIDYLMATKKISKNEAIQFFLQDILKVSNSKVEVENKKISKYLKEVKNQIQEIGLSETFVNEKNFDWIQGEEKNKKVVYTVNCPKLHDFLKNNLDYIFVRNRAKEGILRYYFFDGYYKLISNEEMKGLIKHFIPLELQSTRYINEILNLLFIELKFIHTEDLNDENIINFNNGVLNLTTGKLEDFSPKYLSTIRIPCNYYEKVEPPKTMYFENFMKKLTNGVNEVRELLLQFMGVVISNVKGYRMKRALFLTGKGNTGKSVLKNFLTKMIGEENCSNIDLRKLESQFGKIQLLNKRLVGSNDMSWLKIIELETFKQATGGDPIYAEFKGENGINFKFNGVLWFCTNEMPKFGGDQGNWVYDRFVIVECKNVISEEEQDKFLVSHLLEEKEYIISLAIQSLKKVIKNGYRYDIPECCIKLNSDYKTENNTFLTFMKECCIDRKLGEKIPDDGCTKGKINKVYREWYKENNRGFHYYTTSEIKKLLISIGKADVVTANKGNEYYSKFTLNDKAKKEYQDILGIYVEPSIIPNIEIKGVTDDEINF